MKKLNLVVGVVCICLSLFVIQGTMQFQETIVGKDFTGPKFFPQVLSVVLIALSLMLIVGTLFFMPKEIDAPLNPANLKKPLFGVILLFFYILGLETLGFLVSSFLLNAILLILFRVRKVHMLILYPALLSLAIYIVFRKFLMIDLPEGLIHI